MSISLHAKVPRFFGLVGAGGFGREVMPLVAQDIGARCFLETSPTASAVNDFPCLSIDDFLALDGERLFNVAVADSRARQRLCKLLEAGGAEATSIVATTAIVMPTASVGRAAILCDFSMVTSNATVGNFFHANIYSYVAHDCVVGDFVTLAPKACINGNVNVGDHAYIGTGALIKPGTRDNPLTIGPGAVVGMGAVVTKDVPAGAVVKGNPAR
jgi:sugar O-acyltransferase (sialic acid O-acetyltransferase NeuD family)